MEAREYNAQAPSFRTGRGKDANVTRSAVVWVLAGWTAFCLPARAMGDAAGDYKSLFGEEEKALGGGARATTNFADKLLKAAKGLGEQKDLQALLCDKAYEHGMKDPAGYSTAIEAMRLLVQASPDRKKDAQGKLLDACELRFAKSPRADRKRLGEELADLLVEAGDERAGARQLADAMAIYRKALVVANGVGAARAGEIADKIKQTTSDIELEARLAELKKRLKDNPKSVAARTSLILAYLGEADTPAEALKLLSDELDEKFRTYVPLSGRPVAELEEGVCLELASWYLDMSEKASPSGKGVILGKARSCCQRYMELHEAQDVARLKAGMLQEKIDKAMNKGGPLDGRAAASLVLYLGFDKNDPAKVADLSGKGNHATVVGARYVPQGRKGGAYSLSGSNEHLTVANSNSLEIRDKLTLAAWVNLASLGPGGYGNEHGYVINKGNDLWWNPAFCLGYAKAGQPLFHVGNAVEPQRGGKTVSGTTVLAAGKWTHLAGAYDGATLKVYVNGRLEGTEKYSGQIRSDKAPIHLGGGSLRGVDWGNHFTVHGTIDEVMIFDRALSAGEVRQLCLGGGNP